MARPTHHDSDMVILIVKKYNLNPGKSIHALHQFLSTLTPQKRDKIVYAMLGG
jgi:hypothetical protein